MFRVLTELRVLKTIVDMSQSATQSDINRVHFINDTLFKALNADEIQKFTQIFFEYPGFKEAYESARPPRHDLKTLAALPSNTLGYQYAKFMNETGFSIDWYPPMEEKSPLHFARNRQYETHDILHVVTGFWGGTLNEIGLQGFYTAQMVPNATAMTLFAAASLNRLKTSEPEGNLLLLDYIFEGYQMGKKAKKVIFHKWEQDFERDIDELRTELSIDAYTGHLPPLS